MIDTGGLAMMANDRCRLCGGHGFRPDRGLNCVIPCDCALLAIFNACYARYEAEERKRGAAACGAMLERHSHRGRHGSSVSYGMVGREYCADFVLTCRRALSVLHPQFRATFERWMAGGSGQGWMIRNLKSACGLALCTGAPYSLFPLDEYFSRDRVEVLDDFNRKTIKAVVNGRGEEPVFAYKTFGPLSSDFIFKNKAA